MSERKIKSIEYLCGGHGFKADTSMFALKISFEKDYHTEQTFFGYTKDGEGYIFNTMIDCIRYYATGEYVEERIAFDDDSLTDILELEGEAFTDFWVEANKYHWFHN